MWEADLEEVLRRSAALDPARELAEARGRAVRWRAVEPFSSFFLPLPLVLQLVPAIGGDWATEPQDRGFGEAVGLDAAGRPVAHVLDPGDRHERLKHAWAWDPDGSFVELELMGSGPHVRRARTHDGRLVHVAAVSRGDEVRVDLLGWSDGAPRRADTATASRWHAGAEARLALPGTDGRVERLVEARELWRSRPAEGASRPSIPELVNELREGLARAAALAPDALVWDGRVQAPEPWPGAAAAHALVEPLAEALDAAFRAAAAEAGVERPFLLEVRAGGHGAAYPPFGRLASSAFRDGIRSAVPRDAAAIEHLWRGVEAGHTAELDVVEHLGPEALHACRVLSSASDSGAPDTAREEARPVIDALGDRLAEHLNRSPWTSVAPHFLALVHVGTWSPDEELRPLRRARRALGVEAVTAFLESVRSTATPPDPELAQAALEDRGALERLLRAGGLDAQAHRLAREAAAPGLRLEPVPDGRRPGSRLGGTALLPPGEPWPLTADGRPLGFLAGLDLEEVHAPGSPRAGWLLFFADLDHLDGEGLLEPERNLPGARGRVLRVPPGATPVAAEPPAAAPDELVLACRPVVGRRVLTLPEDDGAAARLGLDLFAAQAYDVVIEALRSALHPADALDRSRDERRRLGVPAGWEHDGDAEPGGIGLSEEEHEALGVWIATLDANPGWDGFSEVEDLLDEDEDDEEGDHEDDFEDGGSWAGPEADHWVGGHAAGVQGEEPEPGTILLLHVSADGGLQLEIMDGGVIQFRIPADALAAEDWSQVVASPDSC